MHSNFEEPTDFPASDIEVNLDPELAKRIQSDFASAPESVKSSELDPPPAKKTPLENRIIQAFLESLGFRKTARFQEQVKKALEETP